MLCRQFFLCCILVLAGCTIGDDSDSVCDASDPQGCFKLENWQSEFANSIEQFSVASSSEDYHKLSDSFKRLYEQWKKHKPTGLGFNPKAIGDAADVCKHAANSKWNTAGRYLVVLSRRHPKLQMLADACTQQIIKLTAGPLLPVSGQPHNLPQDISLPARGGHILGLTAAPLHDPECFSIGRLLAEHADAISSEVLKAPDFGLQAVGSNTAKKDASMVLTGKWSDAHVFNQGAPIEKNCKQLKLLCKLLQEEMPEITSNEIGLLSLTSMTPGTFVVPHRGGTNALITLHLTISLPKTTKLGLFVGGRFRQWRQKSVLAFDDAFEHFIFHDGPKESGDRLILLARIWHPEVTLEERKWEMRQQKSERMSAKQRKAALAYLDSSEAKERWREEFQLFRSKKCQKTRVTKPHPGILDENGYMTKRRVEDVRATLKG